jgi:hypothetical protein
MNFIEKYECLKCGSHGEYPGPINVGSTCPACGSWWIVPLLVFVYPHKVTPSERRRKFKLIKGEKDE